MTVVASNFERKTNDLYETEEWATKALLRHIDVRDCHVWEPSAGNGKISEVLARHGAGVTSTDIVQYAYPLRFAADFLDPKLEGDSNEAVNWIITNPPYGKGNRDAVRYAELALNRADNVALLLTAKFDFGKTRQHLFRDNPRFRMKIALTDRIQWFPGATTGTEDHAWYVWGPDRYEPLMAWEGKE